MKILWMIIMIKMLYSAVWSSIWLVQSVIRLKVNGNEWDIDGLTKIIYYINIISYLN